MNILKTVYDEVWSSGTSNSQSLFHKIMQLLVYSVLWLNTERLRLTHNNIKALQALHDAPPLR